MKQVTNRPGTGSSSTRWPSSDLDARRKSTRWPTYQALAAGRPGAQVQIWTREGNQPGGHLTRHRQPLDQLAKLRTARHREIRHVSILPGS
ncbi:hypothetical protein DM081_30270, partial [Klebsiella pneumoniae]